MCYNNYAGYNMINKWLHSTISIKQYDNNTENANCITSYTQQNIRNSS